MGTVITVDFKRRRGTHVNDDQSAMSGPPGQPLALAISVACLACMHAPLLMVWGPWLPLRYPQAQRPGGGVKEM